MIKIIKGKYGHYIPNNADDLSKGGRLVPVTPDSAPLSLSPEQEKRLVERGVAKYVDAAEPAGAGTQQDPPASPDTNPLAYNEEMKLEALKAVAINGYKCDADAINKMRTKTEVIAVIDQAKAGGKHSGTPAGEQPNLTPSGPVQ